MRDGRRAPQVSGNASGTSSGSEVGSWTAGTVDMSGGDLFQYSNVTMSFTANAQVALSADYSGNSFTWTGNYTRNGDTITTNEMQEATAGPGDVMDLTLTVTSTTAMNGTMQETYTDNNGGVVTVSGSFSATR